MKRAGKKSKVMQLIIVIILISVPSYYLLKKYNFYNSSFAASPAFATQDQGIGIAQSSEKTSSSATTALSSGTTQDLTSGSTQGVNSSGSTQGVTSGSAQTVGTAQSSGNTQNSMTTGQTVMDIAVRDTDSFGTVHTSQTSGVVETKGNTQPGTAVDPSTYKSLGITPAAPADTVPTANTLAPFSYADAVALAAPSVVSINTTTEIPLETNPMMQDPLFRYFFGEPFGIENENGGGRGRGSDNNRTESTPGSPDTKTEIPKAIQKGLGSGVIVSDKGYILTNNHVVRDSTTVSVKLADGRTAVAKLIGSDLDTDLAVLKIDLDKLPVISMGSSQKLRVGDVVLAIGNAFGFDNTVTQGIISATERSGLEIGNLENLIQTDAAINFGNSGGALIDARGRLIGINTAMYSRTGGYQGIGFAIPIDQAIEVMKQLIQGGHIVRGYLGISMQSLNKEIRDIVNYKEGDGILVRATVLGGPAQKAGLLPGDVITKINNTVVKDDRQALKLVAALTPGKSYPIEVFRKGEIMHYFIVPVERSEAQKKIQEKR